MSGASDAAEEEQVSGRPPEDEALTQILVLRVETREYALPVHRVLEAVRMVAITPLPEAPPWLEGLINFRGRVVPVVDLRARLGLARREPDPSTAIVMMAAESGPFGLIADHLVEVLSLSTAQDESGSNERPMSPAVATTVRHGDRLMLVLDPDGLHDGSVDALLPTVPGMDGERG